MWDYEVLLISCKRLGVNKDIITDTFFNINRTQNRNFMRYVTTFTVLSIILSHFSCNKYSNQLDSELLQLELLMDSNPDSSLFLLKNNWNNKELNNYNRLYYSILFIENLDMLGEPLYPYDSLLNSAILSLESNCNKDLLARLWLNKGRIYGEIDENKDALSCFREATKYVNKKEKIKQPTNYEINNELADIYTEIGRYKKALTRYRENSYLYESDKIKSAFSLRNMGYTYLFISQPDSAFFYLNKALTVSKQAENSTFLSNLIYSDLSIYYENLDSLEKSLEFLRKIEPKSCSCFLNKGIIYNKMHEYDSAKYYFLEAACSNYLYTKASCYFFLNQIEDSLQNIAESKIYLQKYHELRDSIELQKKGSNINEIIHFYDLHTEVEQINRNHKTKNIIIGFCLIFLLMFIILIILKRDKQKKEDSRQRETEIKKLINQIKTTEQTIEELEIRKNENEELQCKIFKMKDIYKTIEQLMEQDQIKKDKRVLKLEERIVLQEEIFLCFSEFIQSLQETCPQLNDDDIKLCCLTKLNLPLSVICLCFGSIGTNNIRQRKYKLKKKMTKESDNAQLFYSIFPKKEMEN